VEIIFDEDFPKEKHELIFLSMYCSSHEMVMFALSAIFICSKNVELKNILRVFFVFYQIISLYSLVVERQSSKLEVESSILSGGRTFLESLRDRTDRWNLS
jgi:hypothetical protein